LIKNLLGKKEEAGDKDAEVQKLREKLGDIANSDTKEQPNSAETPAKPETGIPAQPSTGVPAQPNQQFKYVDPERAEDNERVTNLIMQQIKELIQIDNNLNAKIKDVENKLAENASTLTNTKSVVEQFNSRLEFIEKNMEKFMGLYEVVTNRFNPFVAEEDQEPVRTAPGTLVVEDAIKKTTPPIDVLPSNTKTPKNAKNEEQKINKETDDIIKEANIQLEPEQVRVVEDELKKAILDMGSDKADDMKKELAKHIGDVVGAELKKAMEHHSKVTNEELKKSIGTMLLETANHIKQTIQPGAASPNTAVAQNKPNPEIHEEVHPDYHFNLADGTEVKSVAGLITALDQMDASVFGSHVTEEKNDFADWIEVVLNNPAMAQKMRAEKTREGIKKLLSSL